jgi:hypothetical protein
MTPQERFENLVAEAGEWFTDYVIVVRTPEGTIVRHSDKCWAHGAARRLLIEWDAQDRVMAAESARRMLDDEEGDR